MKESAFRSLSNDKEFPTHFVYILHVLLRGESSLDKNTALNSPTTTDKPSVIRHLLFGRDVGTHINGDGTLFLVYYRCVFIFVQAYLMSLFNYSGGRGLSTL